MTEPLEAPRAKTVVVRCDTAHLDRARRIMAQRLGVPTLSDRAVLDIALQAYDPTERWAWPGPGGGSVGALLEIPEALVDDIRAEVHHANRTLEDIVLERFDR